MSNFACELYRYFGLDDEAIAAGERALQLDPTFLYSEPLLAALYREIGRFDDAIALYEKSQTISGRVPFGLAITYGKMNRREEAMEDSQGRLREPRELHAGDAIAHVHVVLQENEDAIRELQRAYRGTFVVIALRWDCARFEPCGVTNVLSRSSRKSGWNRRKSSQQRRLDY